MKTKKSKLVIDISLEDYFLINEEARKEGKLLDEKIEEMLRESIKNYE